VVSLEFFFFSKHSSKTATSHQGLVRTKRRAQQIVLRPGTPNACQTLFKISREVAEAVTGTPDVGSATRFRIRGRIGRFFPARQPSCADRLSGWPVIHQWRRDPTVREVVQAIVHNFVELGVPMRFRSDNGSQFDAGIFKKTLKRWVSEETLHPNTPKQRTCGGSSEGDERIRGKDGPIWRLIFGSLLRGSTGISEYS
jgi:hypothetical protein